MTAKSLLPAILTVLSVFCSIAAGSEPLRQGKIIGFKHQESFSSSGEQKSASTRPQAAGETPAAAEQVCYLYIRSGEDMFQSELTTGCNDTTNKDWSQGKSVNFRISGRDLFVLNAGQETRMKLINVSKYDPALAAGKNGPKVLTTMPPKKKQ